MQPLLFPLDVVLLCLYGPWWCFSLIPLLWDFHNGVFFLWIVAIGLLVSGTNIGNDLSCHLDGIIPEAIFFPPETIYMAFASFLGIWPTWDLFLYWNIFLNLDFKSSEYNLLLKTLEFFLSKPLASTKVDASTFSYSPCLQKDLFLLYSHSKGLFLLLLSLY